MLTSPTDSSMRLVSNHRMSFGTLKCYLQRFMIVSANLWDSLPFHFYHKEFYFLAFDCCLHSDQYPNWIYRTENHLKPLFWSFCQRRLGCTLLCLVGGLPDLTSSLCPTSLADTFQSTWCSLHCPWSQGIRSILIIEISLSIPIRHSLDFSDSPNSYLISRSSCSFLSLTKTDSRLCFLNSRQMFWLRSFHHWQYLKPNKRS